MTLLEHFLKDVPEDVEITISIKKKPIAEVTLEGKEVIIDVKNPILAVETVLKQISSGGLQSLTLDRLKEMKYKVKVRWKGLSFDL